MGKNQAIKSFMHIALFIRSFGSSGGVRFMVNIARSQEFSLGHAAEEYIELSRRLCAR